MNEIKLKKNKSVRACDPSYTQFDLRVCGRER